MAAFSQKTFKLLKQNVLDSMAYHGSKPVELKQPKPSLATMICTIVGGFHRALLAERGDYDPISGLFENFVRGLAKQLGTQEIAVTRNYHAYDRDTGKLHYSLTAVKPVGQPLDTVMVPFRTVFRENVSIAKLLEDILSLAVADKAWLQHREVQGALKEVQNAHAGDKLYLYFTDSMIPHHYRVLGATQNHGSCMSKSFSYYEQHRPDWAFGHSRCERHVHPTEGYEKNPEIRLGLVAKHHSTWTDDSYPFIARAICKYNADGRTVSSYVRVYGDEKAITAVRKTLDCRDLDNVRLTPLYNADGGPLAPYVDGEAQYIESDFYISSGSTNVDHSTGTLEQGIAVPTRDGDYYPEDDVRYCDQRGEYIHENDAVYDSYSEQYYFDGDENEDWFRSDVTNAIHYMGDEITLYNSDERIGENEVDDYRVTYLDYVEEYARTCECTSLYDGGYVHDDDIGRLAEACAYSQELYLKEDMTTASDGACVATDNLHEYEEQLEQNHEDDQQVA